VSGGVAVLRDDNLIFGDRAEKLCAGFDFSLAGAGTEVRVTIQVDDGFPAAFTIGSSGLALAFNQILHLRLEAPSETASYFNTVVHSGQADGTDLCIVDSAGPANPALILDGVVTNIVVPSGRMALAAGATLEDRADIYGARGGQTSLLTIPAGATLSGSKIHIMGGFADISADVPEVFISDGEFVLNGIADITTALEMKGGQFWWDAAASTIALGEIHGGIMAIRLVRAGRILSNAVLGGDGNMDFRKGGLTEALLPNGILVIGDNEPMLPRGTILTPTFGSSGMAR
jgi:hypothetical protein